MQQKIDLGVSKLAPNYEHWLRKLDDHLEITDLYSLTLEEAKSRVQQMSGILLTGGCDIHPSKYGRNEDIGYCKHMDLKRDELELAVIEAALRYKIPVLGICRGQQMLNVAMNGTLYADIRSFCPDAMQHSDDGVDAVHPVKIEKDSLLFRLTGVTDGVVNSAHHQALNRIAPGFIVTAISPDSIIEAIESTDSMGHPFCLTVQWHPERMGLNNPLSGKLGKGFIEAACRKSNR